MAKVKKPKRGFGFCVEKGAAFSPDRLYRYALWRIWDRRRPQLAVVGLNPSTADEKADDPTITRCTGFAKAWSLGGLVMLNLFAYRATDPKELLLIQDPVGKDNDRTIVECCDKAQGPVIVAWGNGGSLQGRDLAVLALLSSFQVCCLGKTKDGYPRHPLYMPKDAVREVYP